MPLLPPALDDRSFDDLVDEVLSRIPAHTPEWTNPRQGDPGRTIIELFAWLTDTLLYRANLVPERQRLAFLRLLGAQMRPAIAARGLVSISIDDDQSTDAIYLQPLGTLKKGPLNFETQTEITVLPVVAEAYYKRPLSEEEESSLASVVEGLQQIYDIDGEAAPYVNTPVFASGVPETDGFDLIERTVDGCLWLALLTVNKKPDANFINAVRKTLGENQNGGQQLINVGVMPSIQVPALFEEIGKRASIPHVWEMTFVNEKNEVEYSTLDEFDDTTAGLTRRGTIRLALPSERHIGAPTNNVRERLNAGVGDQPPRLDIPETAARLVAWLRLRPTEEVASMRLSWVGINAVEIDQRQTVRGRVVGQSDGSTDQQMQLPGQSVEQRSLQLQVEEAGLGYQFWRQTDDLAVETADARVYSLDSEAGTVRFGDGVRGRIPDPGSRVRVALMRAGGGRAGNLPAGSLTEISAKNLEETLITNLKVLQPLPTEGGEDSESLDAAEQRIPALFRHRDRAVTVEDYRRLAADTPGIRMGRVEVLRNFKPQQRRSDVPGVVSVMVLPMKETISHPNPRPDRPFIESVHSYLDQRRSLTTELYVIGCEYVQIGISVAIAIRDGFSTSATREQTPTLATGLGRDGALNSVREALRRHLWSLAPGGIDGTGWQLGRTVRDRELEVIVSQVAGVAGVAGINLFARRDNEWVKVPRRDTCAPVEIRLEPWQLPELLAVVAVVGDSAPENLRGLPNPFAGKPGGPGRPGRPGVAVPVVPEVC